jgi:hypothetical protein
MRNVIDDLVERISRIRLLFSRQTAARLREITKEPAHGVEALRWRLRTSRLGRSADGIIVVPLLGIVLVLGVFAATAAKHQSADRPDSGFAAALNGSDVSASIVTETESHVVTVRRPGKPKVVTVERQSAGRRIVKGPGGVSTIFESVRNPPETKTVAGPTKTVTVTGPTNTVTQIVTETVTTVVTVTEKKKP